MSKLNEIVEKNKGKDLTKIVIECMLNMSMEEMLEVHSEFKEFCENRKHKPISDWTYNEYITYVIGSSVEGAFALKYNTLTNELNEAKDKIASMRML